MNTDKRGIQLNLQQLTERAMVIRQRYAEREQAQTGHPWTREELMQGFVVDVGQLMKLVMAKSGRREVADVDTKLEHELADCLWSVLVLAREYGIEPERAFLRTMDELEVRFQP
jgi:NTP pyrophosphatase (non-canonical NTP hydrolase)